MESGEGLRVGQKVGESKVGDSRQPTPSHPQESPTPRAMAQSQEILDDVSSSDTDSGGVKLEETGGSNHDSSYVKVPKRTKQKHHRMARRQSQVPNVASDIAIVEDTKTTDDGQIKSTPSTSHKRLFDHKAPKVVTAQDAFPSAAQGYRSGQFVTTGSRRGDVGGGGALALSYRAQDNGWVEFRDLKAAQPSTEGTNTQGYSKYNVPTLPDLPKENPEAKKAAALSAWAAFPAKAAREDKADALAYKPPTSGKITVNEIVIKETYKKVVVGEKFERKIVEKRVNILG